MAVSDPPRRCMDPSSSLLDIRCVASPARSRYSSQVDISTPAPKGAGVSPSSTSKSQEPRANDASSCAKPFQAALQAAMRPPLTPASKSELVGAGIKRNLEEAEMLQETPEEKARRRDAVDNLEKALLAAAPSATKILAVIKGEQCESTLANAIARLANAVNQEKKTRHCDSICERLRGERVSRLWPSIQERLEKQVRFNTTHEGDDQQRLKLQIDMVPEEAPRHWLNEYEAKGQLKELLADTRSQLKFVAIVELGLGHIFQGSEGKELVFTYCKKSSKLAIQEKEPAC